MRVFIALPVTADMVPDFTAETAGERFLVISYGGKGVVYSYVVSEQEG